MSDDAIAGALILAARESRRLNQPCEKRGFGLAEQDALDGENDFGWVELDEMKGARTTRRALQRRQR